MQEPLISVIVPVYKVEPYLRKCLDSIVNQSYRNLEIILVDDGSPDQCGVICDEYAAKDARIIVIHQENGGVSSARNAGLAVATGEWIGWVDSDDWIENDMFEYLLQSALRRGADIAVCGRCEHYRNRMNSRGWEQERLLDTEAALKLLLENDIMQNFLWDKLWKRELFQGVTFPVGRTFEDVAIMHNIFARARQILCLPGNKYNYVLHGQGIVGNNTLKNKVNYYLAALNRYEEMRKDWPQFAPLLASQCVASAIGIWGSYYSNPKRERKRIRPKLKEIAAFAKEHYKTVLQTMNLGITGRAVVRLIPYVKWWAFGLSWLMSKLYQLQHGRAL